jgi:2,3,4,5-tetrahydropyridine-2,6-dicarboxylate N-succinyltransferase
MSNPSAFAEAQATIEAAFADRTLLESNRAKVTAAVAATIEALDKGVLRVASPPDVAGDAWIVHAWVKQAILLYFGLQTSSALRLSGAEANGALAGAGDGWEFFDKIPLKQGLKEAGVRVVPPGTARYGSHLERGAILMPGYVNIGARVGAGSMVDTWATVGSCAQVGKDVHLAGGVGIGGVLEPPSARPVVIEDGAFVGSRVVIVEGVHIGKEAVIGAGVVLTATTMIVDVTGKEPVESRGAIPARSIVIPGTRQKVFPAGTFGVPCALIVGQRNESTDKKVSLNEALREHAVPV